MSSALTLLLTLPILLASAVFAVPTEPYPPTKLSPPPNTYPNGTSNPFYPCGFTTSQVSACPYRCFDAATRSLQPQCFSESSATAAIASLQSICVKCQIPDQIEDRPGGCEPLTNYFNGSRPARCGFENHRLRECAWSCNAAQTPFTFCDSRDSTSMFSLCKKCTPQCSSPRIVFQPSYLPAKFSTAKGDCTLQYGPQQRVACPYRCKDAGNPNRYCSFGDKADRFTECERCG